MYRISRRSHRRRGESRIIIVVLRRREFGQLKGLVSFGVLVVGTEQILRGRNHASIFSARKRTEIDHTKDQHQS